MTLQQATKLVVVEPEMACRGGLIVATEGQGPLEQTSFVVRDAFAKSVSG
jgi:hypothetical protein